MIKSTGRIEGYVGNEQEILSGSKSLFCTLACFINW
jgi:hypothetical protein